MKKTLCVLLAALILVLLTACGSAKLPDGMTEDGITAAAKETIDLLNAKDYDAIVATMRDDLQETLTNDKISQAWEPFYEGLGDFDSISKTTIGAQKDYATAVVSAKYSNKTASFTLSYDADMKLIGIYFK